MPRVFKRYTSAFATRERDAFGVSTSGGPPVQPRVSRATREFLETADRLVKGREAGGPKVALKATALMEIERRLSSFRERDFLNPQARAAYRMLRAAQAAHDEKTRRSSGKVPPSGGNKSYFNPTGKDFASTVYGTIARIAVGPVAEWIPIFENPQRVVPCVQRDVRRQVMFAKRLAGIGHKTKKRRTWSSGIGC